MKVRIEDVPVLAGDEVTHFVSVVLAKGTVIEPGLQSMARQNVESNMRVWQRNPPSCVHLRALDEDALVGVILVKDFWNLCALFVHSDYQRRGIGSALLEEALERCRDSSPRGALYVNPVASAVPFYEVHGFVARTTSNGTGIGYLPMLRPL